MRPWACVWRSCERSVWANHSCFFLFSLSSVFQSFLIIILHANCRLASRFEKRSRVKSQESSKSQDDCPPGSCLATWSWLDGETASPVEIHPPRSWLPCSVSRCRGKYTKPHQKFEIRTTTSHTGSSFHMFQLPYPDLAQTPSKSYTCPLPKLKKRRW
jgi:hypothetical protein